MEQKKSNSLGGIWVKQNQYGEYLSITIEENGVKKNYMAIPNKYKTEDKHPTYKILAPKEDKKPAPTSSGFQQNYR